MSSSKMSCSICAEVYINRDDVWSTSCGHIYHLECLRDWQARSSECPQCRAHNPQTHKVYLTFDDPTADDQKMSELELKLTESLTHAAQLQQQVEQCEQDFYNLQAQFNQREDQLKEVQFQHDCLLTEKESCVRVVEELTDVKNQLEQSIGSGSALQLQFDETVRNYQELEAQFNRNLSILGEYELQMQSPLDDGELNAMLMEKEKKLAAKEKQMDEIRKQLDIAMAKNNTEKMLFESLMKQTTLALEKEVRNNTELYIDKIKLQKLLDQFNAMSAPPTDRPERVNKGVAVHGFTEADILTPAIFLLIRLLEKMDLKFTDSEVYNSRWLEKTLVVFFKTDESRDRFLDAGKKLEKFAETKHLKFADFKGSTCYPLFLYAKVLRNCGYRYIFIKNNIVFARKSKFSPDMVKIESVEQVNKMLLDAKVEDKKRQPAKPESTKPQSAKPQSAKPQPAKQQSAKPQPAKPQSAKQRIVKTQGAKALAAQPQAAKTLDAFLLPVEPQAAAQPEGAKALDGILLAAPPEAAKALDGILLDDQPLTSTSLIFPTADMLEQFQFFLRTSHGMAP